MLNLKNHPIKDIQASNIRTHELVSIGSILISVGDIIADKEIDIINDIYSIDQLHNMSFKNIDVKQIFYFHIIKGICEYIDSSKSNRSHVLYYSSCDLKFLELSNYIDNFKIKQFIDTLTRYISNLLPVTFYSSVQCFDRMTSRDGETLEHINIIKGIINKKVNNISTERTRKYLTSKGFKYLNEKYFTKYKQMMFFYK
jgi:hypothetical protein